MVENQVKILNQERVNNMPYTPLDDSGLDYLPSFDPNNIKDKITKLTMNNNPWNMANSGGSALGKPGAALGAPGSALGASSGPALGVGASSTGAFNGSLTAPSTTGQFSLTGVKGANDLGLKEGAGKAGGMSGMNMANMGMGVATAAGVPQAIFGKQTGNVLGNGATGAMTGFSMGGPIGAGIGGGLGALQGIMGNKEGSKKPYNGPIGTADPNAFYSMG